MASVNMSQFERQQDMLPMSRVLKESVLVIGAGAVGSPLIRGLAHMGVRDFTIVDPDLITIVNVATQGYTSRNVGRSKAEIWRDLLLANYDGMTARCFVERYDVNKHGCRQTVFCCVDSIGDRKAIWEATEDDHLFWCDVRMLAYAIRVFSAYDRRTRAHYETSIFPQDEAEPGRCTARSAIWPATTAAMFAINQYAGYLNNIDPPAEVFFNLASYVLDVPRVEDVPDVPSAPAPVPDDDEDAVPPAPVVTAVEVGVDDRPVPVAQGTVSVPVGQLTPSGEPVAAIFPGVPPTAYSDLFVRSGIVFEPRTIVTPPEPNPAVVVDPGVLFTAAISQGELLTSPPIGPDASSAPAVGPDAPPTAPVVPPPAEASAPQA